MAVFLVTFDLKDAGSAAAMAEALKETSWTQLGPGTYAISTDESDEALFYRLRDLAADRDSLYIVALRMPYRGIGFREVNHWLEENLRW